MKELLNNKEDFKNWRLHYFNDILNSYEECEPKEYPCVVGITGDAETLGKFHLCDKEYAGEEIFGSAGIG